MSYSQFQIGFWHPFGPHGGESVEEILERKSREIGENGWTLWSFQKRRVLDVWRREIVAAGPNAVYVFCSKGIGAADLPNEPAPCRSYRLIGDAAWQPLLKAISVPHPFRRGANEASAFVVQRVVYPVDPFELPTVEWFSLKSGLYRFFFYSADRGEPAHIHVEREAKQVKFWLDPVRLHESRGFNRAEINRLKELVERNKSMLLEAWHEFFGK